MDRTAGTSSWDRHTDDELIELVRTGDGEAFGELYARHLPAAERVARAMRAADPDELVAEAFARVLAKMQDGGGPATNFAGYVFACIRNLHRQQLRRAVTEETASDQEWLFDEPMPEPEAVAEVAHERATRAFASLPEAWQQVLWQLEVEGRKPAELSTELGVTSGAVSALVYRAREGLKQAYLREHLPIVGASGCTWTRDRLSQHVRGDLSARATERVTAHLGLCPACLEVFTELDRVNQRIGAYLWPIILLGGASAIGHHAAPATDADSAGGSDSGGLEAQAGAAHGTGTGTAGSSAAGTATGAATGAAQTGSALVAAGTAKTGLAALGGTVGSALVGGAAPIIALIATAAAVVTVSILVLTAQDAQVTSEPAVLDAQSVAPSSQPPSSEPAGPPTTPAPTTTPTAATPGPATTSTTTAPTREPTRSQSAAPSSKPGTTTTPSPTSTPTTPTTPPTTTPTSPPPTTTPPSAPLLGLDLGLGQAAWAQPTLGDFELDLEVTATSSAPMTGKWVNVEFTFTVDFGLSLAGPTGWTCRAPNGGVVGAGIDYYFAAGTLITCDYLLDAEAPPPWLALRLFGIDLPGNGTARVYAHSNTDPATGNDSRGL